MFLPHGLHRTAVKYGTTTTTTDNGVTTVTSYWSANKNDLDQGWAKQNGFTVTKNNWDVVFTKQSGDGVECHIMTTNPQQHGVGDVSQWTVYDRETLDLLGPYDGVKYLYNIRHHYGIVYAVEQKESFDLEDLYNAAEDREEAAAIISGNVVDTTTWGKAVWLATRVEASRYGIVAIPDIRANDYLPVRIDI